MKFSVVTPNFNGARFLEETIVSVISQREQGVNLEYIVVDGESRDGSLEILEKYREDIDVLIVEKDTGPANAINKGFARASGDIVSWLNADDVYYPKTLLRVQNLFEKDPEPFFCFGKCPIIDERGYEIRGAITRFKELFFPLSCRFVFRSINYISQPSVFFRREIINGAGPYIREDMVAAWDYEFFLRFWRQGKGKLIKGEPIAAFRWYESSISGQNFKTQFREELEAAAEDAGRYSLPVLLHHGVRLGIVGYTCSWPEEGVWVTMDVDDLHIGINTLFHVPGDVGGTERISWRS